VKLIKHILKREMRLQVQILTPTVETQEERQREQKKETETEEQRQRWRQRREMTAQEKQIQRFSENPFPSSTPCSFSASV
jgi:serine phosphatase RsbU (regulator of sigma subunit)